MLSEFYLQKLLNMLLYKIIFFCFFYLLLSFITSALISIRSNVDAFAINNILFRVQSHVK